ncbi:MULTISPECIES: hypothetical protein [Acinetobacter]|uniref:Uncharacterized protein n=1 Tax=Acinetobacter piscicola TaxID=2006115 RepID=A0A7S6VW68_9GAMM|nr:MULTISPECIES: hypothetical protein [Acinetobacter]QOW46034.1 hypothetical protein G0028_09085 [Acinetobacter piscicola]
METLSTAIEHHYYGRSEAEELAAYAELSHEKIEGGAMLVGDFSEARKKVDQLLGNSEEFKAYVVTKFPNRSPKILFQQERINHSDYRFMVPEVQLMSDVWQLKQAEVELLQQYNDDLAGGQCCLYRELKKKDKRIEDLEFYVRQFLDVLASTHASHKEVLPKLLSHLNHLVNPKDESGEILRGEYD